MSDLDPDFDDPTLGLEDDHPFVETDPVGAALDDDVVDPTDFDPRFRVDEDVPDGAHLGDVADAVTDLIEGLDGLL